jgi:hypothetical protein
MVKNESPVSNVPSIVAAPSTTRSDATLLSWTNALGIGTMKSIHRRQKAALVTAEGPIVRDHRACYGEISRRRLAANHRRETGEYKMKTKTIRNTTDEETRFAYNDWRNPRSMSCAERERLVREYEKRTGIRIL